MFLAGAPAASDLRWSEQHLVSGHTQSTIRYLSLEHDSPGPLSTAARSCWRAVPMANGPFYQSPHMRKQLAQGDASFSNNRTFHKPDGNSSHDNEFLEHSFAMHADVQSSQIAPQSSLDESTFVTELSTLLEDATSLPNGSSVDESNNVLTSSVPSALRDQIRLPSSITNIRMIPSASHLEQIRPQTMTVNLVAGVISVAPTRTVKVRRGDYYKDIIEVILGDETRAGFAMSSWHDPVESQQDCDKLRNTLQSLRPGDIVCVERLALSSFRGQVFGQSLNRKSARNATSLTVLCRAESLRTLDDSMSSVLPLSLAPKVQKVKDWVASFVGPAKRRRGSDHVPDPLRPRKYSKPTHDAEKYLPPDTQE